MRRDCVTRLISSRMWVISFGGTTASWGYGPGGVEMSPIAVSLSRNTSFTKFSHDEVGHGAAVGRELRVQPLGPLAQPEQALLRDGALAARPPHCRDRIRRRRSGAARRR